MTDEELDELRAAHAYTQALKRNECKIEIVQVAAVAARLARENWQPTDPDLLLAREVVAKFANSPSKWVANVLAGKNDDYGYVQIALAAIRATRGGQL